MLIAQMEDVHIKKTIARYCKELEKARKILEENIKEDTILRVAKNRFSLEEVRKQAESQIRTINNRLKDYAIEAALRGLNISEELQTAYNRKAKMSDYFDWDTGDIELLAAEKTILHSK